MGEFMDWIKGKAKRVEGKVTGNRVRTAEGVADGIKAKVKGAFEELKIDVKRSVREDGVPRKADTRLASRTDGCMGLGVNSSAGPRRPPPGTTNRSA